MACARGCCETPREHYRSLGFRPTTPPPKVTVDHTDHTVNTTTEHWHDRQDVNVKVVKPVEMTLPREMKKEVTNA